jgi:protein-tyrosine phosphatase
MTPDLFWIPGPWPGRLAISSRPRGGDWLEDEIRGWKRAQLDSVISLLERDEERQLDLAEEGNLARKHGIRFVSFPIPDRSVPASVPSAVSMLKSVNLALEAGENVAVHCRQGVGRSALVAVGALMIAGTPPETSLETVRLARGLEVPETKEQLNWVREQLAESVSVIHR